MSSANGRKTRVDVHLTPELVALVDRHKGWVYDTDRRRWVCLAGETSGLRIFSRSQALEQLLRYAEQTMADAQAARRMLANANGVASAPELDDWQRCHEPATITPPAPPDCPAAEETARPHAA